MALVRVEGLDGLRRGFRAYDKALENDLRDALEEAANPVRRDAQSLAVSQIRRMTIPWSRMRVATGRGIRGDRGVVYVAPVERGAKGRGNQRKRRGQGTGPPSFADLLMDRAMEPALVRNESLVIRRTNDALNDFARLWERA